MTPRICTIIHDILGIPAEPDSYLSELGIGQIERSWIALEIEDDFGVRFPDAIINRWERVQDIADAVGELV